MALTGLSIATEGVATTQGFRLPFDRFITIKGRVLNLEGDPVIGKLVRATVYRPPKFNQQELLQVSRVEVRTDQNGEISTNPLNRLRILKSTEEDDLLVRLEIPDAGVNWVLRVPNNQNLIILRDWADQYLVENLARP